MSSCTACGHRLGVGRFCPNCGAPVEPTSPPEAPASWRTDTAERPLPRVEPAEPIYRQMEEFCRAVRERVEPRSSAQLGLEVVATIEAVDRSLQTNGSSAGAQRQGSPADAGIAV